MHEEGFKTALTNVVNKYARAKDLLKEKDENLLGEDIREGLTAIVSVQAARPAVRGPDQGQARQRRRCGRSSRRPPTRSSAEWLEEHPTEANKIVKKALRPRRRPASRPRTPATPSAASRRSTAPACPTSSRTAQPRTADECELFIVEGDSRRRLGHQGPRPAHPGDPADPRQDPQRRAGPHRQDAEEQRDPGADHRDRRRRRRGVRRREGPLPQGHHAGRRRRRRQPHPHAAAHVLLPPDDAAGRGRLRVHRPAAAVLDRGRQGEGLPEGRRRQGARSSPSTRTTRRSSSGSRASARWTGTSSSDDHDGRRRRARCCRSTVEEAAIADEVMRDADGRRRRVAQALHPPTPRTCGSSTSDDVTRPTHPRRRRRRRRHRRRSARCRSSRSRSRRRWSAPSSTTRCRSSCRGRCPTCATA